MTMQQQCNLYKKTLLRKTHPKFAWKNGNEPTIWESSKIVVLTRTTVEVDIMCWGEYSTYGHLRPTILDNLEWMTFYF